MKPHRYTAALLLVTASFACTSGEQANQTDAANGEPPVVTIRATDEAFHAPDTIAAGLTRLHLVNEGEHIHMAHAIRLDSGKTAQELLDAYAEAIRTAGPRPTWITRFGGTTAEPNSESTATQYLEPGNYVWVCPIEDAEGVPHFSQGLAHPFVVQPADGDLTPRAERPAATVVIRLLDYSFDTNPPLTPGRHVIRVENVGGDSHDIALLKLATGRTMEDFQAWMQNPQGPPPASLAGSVAPIAPGHEAFFDAELTPGEYLLVCFSTAPDGRTHIEHGMIQQARVG